jgi:hypothetical protein
MAFSRFGTTSKLKLSGTSLVNGARIFSTHAGHLEQPLHLFPCISGDRLLHVTKPARPMQAMCLVVCQFCRREKTSHHVSILY